MKLVNCAVEHFIGRLNGRKVICFGAGTTLIQAQTENVKINGLEEHIAFFIDNDKSKQGLTYEYCNRTYDIKSVEAFKNIVAKDYVILITCSAYADIYSQLKGIPETRDMECYMYEPLCFGGDEIDLENFFSHEVEKRPYKEWKNILRQMHLKDKHKNRRCFLIGNGPSLTTEDLELLKDEVTFAANAIYLCFERTDWRPTYYFCVDIRGYRRMCDEVKQVNAECRFVPYLGALMAGKVYDGITYYNRQYQSASVKNNRIAFNDKYNFSDNVEEIVYQGSTVVYDMIQFAVYMGFTEIYLLGVDCNYQFEYQPDNTIVETDAVRDHFVEQYDEVFKNLVLGAPVFAMKLAFEKAKEVCDQKGIVIKNATRGGKLEIFERVSFDSLVKKS